jgi:hypothetical protein
MRELVAVYAWITACTVAIYAWTTSTIHSFLGITIDRVARFRFGTALHLMALVMGMCVGDGLTIKPSSVTSTRT